MKKKGWRDRILKGETKEERDEKERYWDAIPENPEPLNLEKHCFLCGWPLGSESPVAEIFEGRTYRSHPDCYKNRPDDLDVPLYIQIAPSSMPNG